jgi:hypothetical protein
MNTTDMVDMNAAKQHLQSASGVCLLLKAVQGASAIKFSPSHVHSFKVRTCMRPSLKQLSKHLHLQLCCQPIGSCMMQSILWHLQPGHHTFKHAVVARLIRQLGKPMRRGEAARCLCGLSICRYSHKIMWCTLLLCLQGVPALVRLKNQQQHNRALLYEWLKATRYSQMMLAQLSGHLRLLHTPLLPPSQPREDTGGKAHADPEAVESAGDLQEDEHAAAPHETLTQVDAQATPSRSACGARLQEAGTEELSASSRRRGSVDEVATDTSNEGEHRPSTATASVPRTWRIKNVGLQNVSGQWKAD